MALSRFHFIFLFFWITKQWQNLCNTLIYMFVYLCPSQHVLKWLNSLHCRYLKLSKFHHSNNLHHIALDVQFLLLLWLFPPNVKHLVWSAEQWAFTYPDLVPVPKPTGPWSLHMSRSRFGLDFSPDQIFDNVYITRFGLDRGPIRIWSGLNWFYKRSQCCLTEVSCHTVYRNDPKILDR